MRRRRRGDDFELDAYKDWLMAEGSETGNIYTYIVSGSLKNSEVY